MSSSWGTSIAIEPWFTVPSTLSFGDKSNIVVLVIAIDGQTVLGTLYPGNQRVRISGFLGHNQDVDSISIFGAKFGGMQGLPSFVIEEDSIVMTFPKITKSDLDVMVEFCAGMGISTIGFEKAGFTVAVANELRPKMAELYLQLHPSTAMVVGDFCCPEVIFKVWEKRPRSSIIFSGFACQPYSRGGKQLGVEDQRASTLRASLTGCFMLRCPVLILECVKEASSNMYVQQEINNFCSQCGYHRSELVLSMEDCWPVRRERWWVVLTAPMIGLVNIMKCPLLQQPCNIGMLMQDPLNITEHELSQLEILEDEYEQFLTYVPDIKSLFLKKHAKAPTALHGWGAQVRACPCQCRAAFSDATLRNRGIYGVVIPVPGSISVHETSHPRIRHPHPVEVAAWNCVPFEGKWPSDLRLVLSGLGQMATPVHAAWISSQVKMHVEKLLRGSPISDCNRVLDNIRLEVLMQCKENFPVGESEVALSFVEAIPRVLPVAVNEVEPVIDQIPCVAELSSSQVQSVCPWWFGLLHEGLPNQVTMVFPGLMTSDIVTLQAPEVTTASELLEGEACLSHNGPLQLVDCCTRIFLEDEELVANRCLALIDMHAMKDESSDDDSDESMQVVDDGYLEAETSPVKALVSPTLPFSVHEYEQDDIDMQQVGSFESLDGRMVDPLCRLGPDQLLSLQPPEVSSLFAFDALRDQTICSVDRLMILEKQGPLLGEDEIRFHACQMMDSCTHDDWFFMDPILAHSILIRLDPNLLHDWARNLPCQPKVVLIVLWLGGHWVPIQASVCSDCLHVSSWDESGNFPPSFNHFLDLLVAELGCSSHALRVEIRRFNTQGYCGMCAVRFLAAATKGRMLPSCVQEVIELHQQGQNLFRSFILSSPMSSRPWIWGNGLSPQASDRLRDLLIQHGVPREITDTRIHLLLATLGTAAVQNALLGSSPWRSIKALANNVKPVFQLVLPDELSAQVKSRSKQGHLSQKKKIKQSVAPAPGLPPPLDPSKLVLEVGAFVHDDSHPLKQLQLSDIGPFAEGVVVSTAQSAQAYLTANQLVNDLPLGLLIVNACEKDMTTQLSWEHLRVPFRCLANNEPVLVSAYLVQLGRVAVKQARHKPTFDLVPDQVSCVKISVYRDSICGSWAEFAKSPIKYILAQVDPLNICTTPGCVDDGTCKRWHRPTSSSLVEPIADIWRRQWLTSEYKPCSVDDASLFLVNVRFAATQELMVLRGSGHAGVFIEPRSIDSKSPNLSYQVLWLPKTTPAEIERLNRCTAVSLGIARMSGKFGLRVLTSDAPEAGRILKPGSVYLAAGPRINFEVGPLPYGLDRIAVSKLCLAWNWQARPLHTQRSLSGPHGAVWLVQSCVEPESNVHHMSHGDVVISRIGEVNPSLAAETNEVVGSGKTVALCTMPKDASSSSDPWFGKDSKDPWSGYVSKIQPPKSASPPNDTIQQVQERIEKSVLSKLSNEPSDHKSVLSQVAAHKDDTDRRFAILEDQLQKIATNQQTFEAKVIETAQRQDADMSQLRHQVTAQIDAQGTRMETLFHQQMQSIEQLLSKRSRSPRRDS